MLAVAEISEDSVTSLVAVKQGEDYSSGVSAKFMPLSESWGFKMYNNLIEAYFTYFAQRLLASIDVAPKLGQQMPAIRTPFNEEQYRGGNPWGLGYGYITATVKLLPKPDYLVTEKQYEEYSKAKRELCRRAFDILGWDMGDLHQENMGWIESAEGVNQWYIIDCGDGMVEHNWKDVLELVEKLQDNDLWRGDDAEYATWGMPLKGVKFPTKRGN